jgi:hypothetical protein
VKKRAENGRDGGDALRSWNDTATRRAIIEFVRDVTTAEHSDFVLTRISA